MREEPIRYSDSKSMLREFEEELVWGHFGIGVENVEHLRLGFYTGISLQSNLIIAVMLSLFWKC